jgi:pyrimidine and pyridine-specific 5'-nucleotidase
MMVNDDTNGVAHLPRKVFFFDIDNCLYPKSFAIHEHMGALIDEYFMKHLSLSKEDAIELHRRYYTEYGLAIEGLVRHHKIDPLEYNAQVDDALPLDDIIKPDPKLRKLLEDIDRSKVKLWLFTNAHITHGRRVVRLLDIEDLFEGITYCDYGAERLLCKPTIEMYDKAMREADAHDTRDCYYVGKEIGIYCCTLWHSDGVLDDSGLNAAAGKAYGWKTAHLVEPESKAPPQPVADFEIRNLEELRTVFAELFKPS